MQHEDLNQNLPEREPDRPLPLSERPHQPQKGKKNKTATALLSLLLVAAVAAGGFFGWQCRRLSQTAEQLSAKVTSLQNDVEETKSRLDTYQNIFGEVTLPALAADDSNYEEVISSYEAAAAGMVTRLTGLREELNTLRSEHKKKESPTSAETAGGSPDTKQPAKKVCYLTFDDGPSENTLKILEILRRYNAKATFFVIGAGKLDYVKNIHDEGHAVALHSNTHSYKQIYSGTDAFFADLEAIRARVEAITGEKTVLMRFPGGSSNTVSKNYCEGIMTELSRMVEERGYFYFDWNVDSGDASGNNIPADKLVGHIKALDYSRYGDICVLCHDAAAKSTTVDALPEMIEYLSTQGYVFEGLSPSARGFHQGINN
ncbi:MAG: polysaccharide deacetylase family protein [Candidatus Howiella sp.]